MKGVNEMITKMEEAKASSMYIGYLILKEIKRQNTTKISIYDVSKALKKSGILSSRQLVFGLSFLFSVEIIDFEEATIWIKN